MDIFTTVQLGGKVINYLALSNSENINPTQKEIAMKYLLNIETDWDFAIKFRGEIFSEYEIDITLDSVEELDEIELLGPFATPLSEDTKVWEFNQAMEAIKANPDQSFCNQGGNRGVDWTPLPQTRPKTKKHNGIVNAFTRSARRQKQQEKETMLILVESTYYADIHMLSDSY